METGAKSIFSKNLFPGGFYDSYFVSEYGKLESFRASKFHACFSIILLTIEGKGAAPIAADPEGEAFLKSLSATMVASVRNCDVVGLHNERQILIILPETDYFGSLAVMRKLSRALEAAGSPSPFSVIFTQATYPKDGKGFEELLGTAVKRISFKKDSLWEKSGFKDQLFWKIIGDLSVSTSYSVFDNSTFEAGGDRPLTEFFIDQIDELLVKEISRAPQKRGILYFASKKISPGHPLVKNLNSAGTFSTKVFLVGEGQENVWDIKTATPIVLDDPRFREIFFTFYLNEESGYALICKENWGATYSCFHTADPYLVEGLITKFQTEYSLQEQLG